jgi:hypothetical protein
MTPKTHDSSRESGLAKKRLKDSDSLRAIPFPTLKNAIGDLRSEERGVDLSEHPLDPVVQWRDVAIHAMRCQ